MESDSESQDQERQSSIELTKEFTKGSCQPCSIIELISLFKNDEKNDIKNTNDNSIVRLTKDYLNSLKPIKIIFQIVFTMKDIKEIKMNMVSHH